MFTSVRVKASADADNLFARPQTPIARREYQGEGEWIVNSLVPPAGDGQRSSPGKANAGTRMVRTLKCGGTTMEFVKVPKGTFTMGSDKTKDTQAESDESPQHTVTLDYDLWWRNTRSQRASSQSS